MSTTTHHPLPPPGVTAPQLYYLFSATINMGQAKKPIPLRGGGVRIVEPFTGGTITGPAFEGTVEGGFAAPVVHADPDAPSINNPTATQLPDIYAYGYASDGSPFYIEEFGIGSGLTQTTRLKVEISGKFEALRDIYILGQPIVNPERTIATIDCFGVPLPPS
ncbi:hypothetical protein DV738_g2790, partial [Chaetothyriales sp. CBS 135597]